MYRLLILSNENGLKEDVYFLDADNDDNSEDYCSASQTVIFDGKVEAMIQVTGHRSPPLGTSTDWDSFWQAVS